MLNQIKVTYLKPVIWVALYNRDSLILSSEPVHNKPQSLNELTDADLAALCIQTQNINTQAFSILVLRYEGLIYRVALRYLRIDADADDATQDTFLKAFRGLYGFRQDAQFKTWLFRILHNVCMTRLAQRKRMESIELAELELPSLAENSIASDDYQQLIDNDAIQQVMDLLSEQERQILILKLIADLSLQEAADTLGLSLSAAKMRFYRAQQHFAEIYTRIHTPTTSGQAHE